MSVPLAIALLVLIPGCAAGLMVVFRHHAPQQRLLADTTHGSAVSHVGGTAFAVILAFVIVVAFQAYNSARTDALNEAADVVNMYRAAALFEPQDRQRVIGDIVCYARSVSEDEFTVMLDGRRSARVDHWLDDLGTQVRRGDFSSPVAAAGLHEMLDQNAARASARRGRLSDATARIPITLWVVLILGGLTTIGFVLSFVDRDEHRFLQPAMTAGAALSITAGLLLIVFLEHPFQGPGAIRPNEMRSSMHHVEVRLHGTPPCDAVGRRV